MTRVSDISSVDFPERDWHEQLSLSSRVVKVTMETANTIKKKKKHAPACLICNTMREKEREIDRSMRYQTSGPAALYDPITRLKSPLKRTDNEVLVCRECSFLLRYKAFQYYRLSVFDEREITQVHNSQLSHRFLIRLTRSWLNLLDIHNFLDLLFKKLSIFFYSLLFFVSWIIARVCNY